ncbi:hypothetical protein TNCV_4097011 [Trichonephila clavipes]|nr:hypothetical protein TNCV_4097011 [Trichonephila clavipes]
MRGGRLLTLLLQAVHPQSWDETELNRTVTYMVLKAKATDRPTRGLFTTDLVILNHGQVTRTTPELAPLSLLPHHNDGRTFQLSTDVHCSPTRKGLQWYWARNRDKPATIRYLDHMGYATVRKG